MGKVFFSSGTVQFSHVGLMCLPLLLNEFVDGIIIVTESVHIPPFWMAKVLFRLDIEAGLEVGPSLLTALILLHP